MTVIGQCFNEEFLLPYWLKHHRKIFDHGIIVDYASTDNSVAIIKELCPTWEVIQNKLPFVAQYTVDEVHEIERRITGWKMALNITEFFCPLNMEFEKITNPQFYRCTPMMFVDHGGFYSDEWRADPESIFDNQLWVVPELDLVGRDENMSRSRILHNMPDGRYHPGRHASFLGWGNRHPDLYLFYMADYPRSLEMMKRRLQIKSKMDPVLEPMATVIEKPKDKGHWWEADDIEQHHNDLIKQSYPVEQVQDRGVLDVLEMYRS